jgi:hypothetical protein
MSAPNLPAEVAAFADRMAAAQGCKVRVEKERSGYHLYMPCPDCLAEHGRKELAAPKYTINVSKHLGIGVDDTDLWLQDWHEVEASRDRRAGLCMRTRQSKKPHMFSVAELLAMPTITQRHPDIHTAAAVISVADSSERQSHWEADPETGVLCPPPPSDGVENLIPLKDLARDHVARHYVESRGFDVDRLWHMFRASYCAREYRYGTNGIYYRRMPGRWKDTPQGRVIFHAMKAGTPMTWQGRVIDCVSEDGRLHHYWHPYDERWDLVETRSHEKAVWMRQSPFDAVNEEGNLEWSPSKYKTAKYSERQLAGWDAAVEANRDREHPWCVLCEGPLDAARVGPGGLAVLGGSMSQECAAAVVNNFAVVLLAFDTDVAGVNAAAGVKRMLEGVRVRIRRSLSPVPGGGDFVLPPPPG